MRSQEEVTTQIALLARFPSDALNNRSRSMRSWLGIPGCIIPVGKFKRMRMWTRKVRCFVHIPEQLRAWLAVSKNANDDSEVDDSLLNVGLFTYPILQAADILAYR